MALNNEHVQTLSRLCPGRPHTNLSRVIPRPPVCVRSSVRRCWVIQPAIKLKSQQLLHCAAQAGLFNQPARDAFGICQQQHQPGYREQREQSQQDHASQAGHHVHYFRQAAASPSHSGPQAQSSAQGWQHVYQMAAAPAAAAPDIRPSRWMGFFTTICGTLAALAAFATALILFVRPLLKRLERLAEASEAASKSFEVASEQFEKACAMAQLDLPPAIESIERTSKEFEELALHLRIMTGGKRKPSPPKTPPDPAEANGKPAKDGTASKAIVGVAPSTPSRNSFQRVAQDVVTLTQALEPAMNQWRQRINRIAASFEHANKSQIPQEPALKAAASAATSAAALPGQLSSQQSSTSEESPSESASTAAAKSASKSADGSSNSSSSKGKDDQQKERQQSHAETSSSNSKPAPEAATPGASSSTSEADLQSRMVQSLVEDVSGTVGKAKESMALKADDQPMSPDAAASLIQEVVNKASASVSTLMRSSPDAATPDSSPRAPSSFTGAAETADRIASEAGTLASSMDESDEAAEKKAELQDVSDRSKSAAKVFKALAIAEEATAAAAHASGALETAVAEARTEGPWFERTHDNGAGRAKESSANGKSSKQASAAGTV